MLMKTDAKTLQEIELQERFQRGINFLDSNCPGWHNRINLKTFLLACGCQCVLGQLFGDYLSARVILSLSDGVGHGFAATTMPEYKILEKMWIKEIQSRQGGK